MNIIFLFMMFLFSWILFGFFYFYGIFIFINVLMYVKEDGLILLVDGEYYLFVFGFF